MALDLYFIDVVCVDASVELRAGMTIDTEDIEHAAEPVWPGVHNVAGQLRTRQHKMADDTHVVIHGGNAVLLFFFNPLLWHSIISLTSFL